MATTDWKTALAGLELGGEVEGGTEEDGVDQGRSVEVRASEGAEREVGSYSGAVRVELDRHGRRGKQATIISGFTVGEGDMAAIAMQLKQRLGVGGSWRGSEILIQGDKRVAVSEILTSLGFRPRTI